MDKALAPFDDAHAPLSPVGLRRSFRPPPTVSGFAPLPPITASPICTPAASTGAYTPSTNRLVLEESASTEGYLTPPTTPSTGTHQVTLPTWVAVPPTPPAKLLARYLTCEPGRPRSALLPPSVSSPASHPTRDPQMTCDDSKRRASFPLHKATNPVPTAVSISTSDMHVSIPLESASCERPAKRPLFHVEDEAVSDSEDVVIPFVDSPPGEIIEELLTPLEDDKRGKEQIRRYCVLLELLSTEASYLTDLHTLVKVYLRLLSTWPCKSPGSFSRNPSFPAVPRINSSSHLLTLNTTSFNPVDIKSSTTLYPPREKEKSLMFSASEMASLSRNIDDVLELHERFVDELRVLMDRLDFPTPSDDTEAEYFQQRPELWINKVDEAIRAVSSKFATEASRFNSYQIFCAGHSEALTLIHKAQHQYPAEWKQFQRQCSAGGPSVEEPPESIQPQQEYESTVPDRACSRYRNRTHSTSSTDSAVHNIRRRSHTGSSDALADPGLRQKGSRLNFTDYLIKPIQRICKYPLLLEQLKFQGIKDKSAEDLDVVVQSATQAMRHVATEVDEARHRQDISIRSSLIALRVASMLTFGNTSPSTPTQPYLSFLTPSFLSSLGVCLLAGSLDVMHAKGTSIPKTAKYYGAFLYPGGYLILVKVKGKGHYEPRHWFPLSGMGVVDIDISEALFPYSFGLSYQSHRFELAASCQREKDVWLVSIQESLTLPNAWINEPTSSLNADNKGEAMVNDQLPTPDSGASADGHIPPPLKALSSAHQYFAPEESRSSILDLPHRSESGKSLPSRRSSTASVKAIFSSSMGYHHPPSPTMIISRSSPTARSAIDQALQDVISESCVSARSQANSREEDLFPVSRLSQSSKPLTKNRLSRHESVRVIRKKSFVAEGSDFGLLPPIPSRARSLVVRTSTYNPQARQEIEELADSLHELRPITRSNTPSSVSSSPVKPTRTLTQPRKATRSMIGDLRELFGSRLTSSSSSSLQDEPKTSPISKPPGFTLLRKWSRSVRHRRSHSAPELPEEDSPIEPKTETGPVLPDIDFGSDMSLPASPNSATPIPVPP